MVKNYEADWEEQASAPSTPDTGKWRIYFKSGGLYVLEDDGTEHGPLSTGSGDVVGPSSATDNAIARFDGVTGKLLQESYPTIDDSGNVDLGGHELRDFAFQIVAANTGAAYEIDWSAGTVFELTLTGSPTFTFANLTAGRSVTLFLIQDGTGSRTVTWPGAVDWPGGEPVLQTAAASIDVVTLVVRNDGSTVEGIDVAGPQMASLNFIIDGGGSAITTGIKGDAVVDFACTIQSATLLADQSGDIVVDIWKDTYANFPPDNGDTITAGAEPTLSSAAKSQDTTLTGWTTTIAAGDVLRFNVDSAATVERVTVSLELQRS